MKKLFVLFSLIFFACSAISNEVVSYIQGEEHTRIVVKLKNSLQRMQLAKEVGIDMYSDVTQLGVIASEFNSSVLPMFESMPMKKSVTVESLQRTGKNKQHSLDLFLEIPLNGNEAQADVVGAIAALKNLAIVETVYAEPKSIPAAVDFDMENVFTLASESMFSTPLLTRNQGYLNSAPLGINAKYAWTVRGGKGRGVHVVDVEGGWQTTHEDFPAMYPQIGTERPGWRNHGTAVVGVIASVENRYGTTGITPNVRVGFSSIGNQSVAGAIKSAADALGRGGIVLIEIHRGGPRHTSCSCNQTQCDYLPVEYWPADYNAIRYAVRKGLIVVEAAGNGSANLDARIYGGRFNRSVRDSEAIMVGASLSRSRTPACFTNYGNRIDVHAWGENVTTTGYGDAFNGGSENSWYTNRFSGTSSASPIVVGAAASVQGILKARSGSVLTSRQMRSLLSRTATSQSGQLRKRIGGLPNIKAAVLAHKSTATVE